MFQNYFFRVTKQCGSKTSLTFCQHSPLTCSNSRLCRLPVPHFPEPQLVQAITSFPIMQMNQPDPTTKDAIKRAAFVRENYFCPFSAAFLPQIQIPNSVGFRTVNGGRFFTFRDLDVGFSTPPLIGVRVSSGLLLLRQDHGSLGETAGTRSN